MLACRDVCVTLEGTPVLRGVSMTVRAGEVLGLIGPNGAGKSTLLRTMAGLAPADVGKVELEGAALHGMSPAMRARAIGYLPQASEVHWPLTVQSLVALGRIPYRRLFAAMDAADEAAIERALERTQLQSLRDRSVGTLSGGERMRALVARMLAVEAPVMLVDEPVAGLDPYFQLQFMDLFAAQAAAGCAVVIVLHDLPLAARYCDRLVMLDSGEVAADGNPGTVLTQELIRDVYHVEALRDRHEDELYVLPWKRATLD